MNELNEEGVYALAAAEKKSIQTRRPFGRLLVGNLKSNVKSDVSPGRAGELVACTPRTPRMSVRYISRDVCQT